MPSGSSGGSRGGGGSHFGGSRGGGGSSGSHYGGSGYRSNYVRGTHNGRAVVFFGTGSTRRYIPAGIYSLLSFFSVIIFFILFSGLGMIMAISGTNEEITTIEADYLHYQDIISDAEQKEQAGQTGYIIYGTVKNRFKSDNSEKWYLTYSFVADDGSVVDNGYTYSTYTWEEVKDISAGDPIKLALEYAPSDEFTDSIDYAYKNTTLEDDGDYIAIMNNKAYLTKICIIEGVCAIAIIVIIAVVRTKNSKLVEDMEPTSPSSGSSNQTSQIPKKKYCKYCGSIVLDGKTSCDHCGAGIYNDSDLM